jgi:hypothetical protein
MGPRHFLKAPVFSGADDQSRTKLPAGNPQNVVVHVDAPFFLILDAGE